MGNPNPIMPQKFVEGKFTRIDGEGVLAERTVQVRLDKDVEKLVRSLPNMSVWIRRVIREAAQRELMADTPDPEVAMVNDRSESIAAKKPIRKRKKGGDE
jgi:hypothetical protein